MWNNTCKLLLFDLDGTLSRSEQNSLVYLRELLGLYSRRFITQVCSNNLTEQRQVGVLQAQRKRYL